MDKKGDKKVGKTNKLHIAVILTLVSGTTMFHYLAPLYLHSLHDIFQRFYYLPIILAALWFGLRGGLACSLAVTFLYVPHVLFQWGDHMDIGVEKYLEIVLYNIVGGVTGLLAQKERQRSQELQQQSEKVMAIETKLRRAEKLSTMGEMAAVLAHEIRNPLGSIRGTAEILKDDYLPGDPKHEFIEIQIKETERLNRVVEDFLRMARPQPVDLKSCSLKEELKIIVTLLSKDARERKIELQLQPFSFEAVVNGDGEKLRQAFLEHHHQRPAGNFARGQGGYQCQTGGKGL